MQRHRLHIAIVLLWLPFYAVAQQCNINSIEAYAKKIWRNDKVFQKGYKLESTILDVEDTPCYVVVRTDETRRDTLPGYMLVANEGERTILLAFDNEAKFTTTSLPPHIKEWVNDYGRISSNYTKEELQKWMEASQTENEDVPPLLGKKEWGQDNPYNLLCPTIDGKHCPTGCIATAVSQIMSYHRWPSQGTGSISYTTSTRKIDINYNFANTSFDWDKMLDTYIPLEDLSSQDDVIVTDDQYFLNSIDIDNNSIAASKCYISISGLTVMGKSSFEGEVVLLATDNNGVIASRVSSSTSISNRSSGRILNDKSFLLYVSSDMADGTYRIYCAVRSNGISNWSLSNAKGKENYISFTKEGSSFTIGDETFPCCPSTEDVIPVSTLLQAVGAAVKMDYNLNGSGSYDAPTLEGLIKYLKYDSDMFFAYPDIYTDEQWHEILQQELVEGRPVYYTGQGTEVGHAFVIDGFKKAEDGTIYYHVNWGWDGLCNGYYLLNMLRPSSTGTGGSSGSNYSNRPSMLIGMIPEDGISTLKMNCSTIDLLANEFSIGDFMPIRIRTLSMQTSMDFVGNLQLQLQSADKDSNPIILYENKCTITSKRGLTNFLASCQVPTDIEGGNYTLKIVCTTNEGEDVEIMCKEWPTINIKDINDWNGGAMTQPLKRLAVGGTFDLKAQEYNGSIILTLDTIANPMSKSTTGELALAICDENGKMLTVPNDKSMVSVSGYNLKRNISISSPISRNMPDGNYELRVSYLPQDESLWTFCDKIQCEDDIWWASFHPFSISMTAKDGEISIQGIGTFEGADTPWTSSISNITNDVSFENCVFDLSGRQTKANQNGIYIIRKNNKITKIIK
jgi:hypothetical protein